MNSRSRSLVYVAVGAVLGAGVSILTPGSDMVAMIPIGAAVGLAASEEQGGCLRRHSKG